MQDQSVDAAYGDLNYVDKAETNRIVRHWRAGTFTAAKLGRGWMPPHPTFYARRSLYARLGTFDITYRIAADFDCMLRFLKAPIRVAYIERVQVLMRVGGASNRSLSNIVTKSFEDLRALRKNQIGSFGALIWKNVSKIPQFFARTSMTISEGKAS